MDLITSPRSVLEEIEAVKRGSRSLVTNYYPNEELLARWIGAGDLSRERIAGTTFLFKREEDFLRLLYVSPSPEALGTGLDALAGRSEILVTEVIAKAASGRALFDLVGRHGFHPYATLVRLSRTGLPAGSFAGLAEGVRLAAADDAPGILRLLVEHFDRFAEQIQSSGEIKREIGAERILVCESDGQIAGFLHFELSGLTSHLRRWFVHPRFRDLHVGSKLLGSYFFLSGKASRFILWVLQSNENAIKRYIHFGYQEDGLHDAIFSNKERMRYGE